MSMTVKTGKLVTAFNRYGKCVHPVIFAEVLEYKTVRVIKRVTMRILNKLGDGKNNELVCPEVLT
jgi:hypothetical protein